MDGLIWALIPIAGIVGGISLAIYKTAAMARVRELEVRERIAMIEKGLIPSPESNPRGFEQAMSAMARGAERDWYDDPQFRSFILHRHYRRAERQRGAGVTLMGIGFGLMLMLAFAAGAILTMLADTMMPEAFEHGGKVVGLATTLGFGLAFALTGLE